MVATAVPTAISASAPVLAPGVPVHLTPFVGREREIEEVLSLLASTRLLTLTGAGGSGKTRLAAEVLERDGGRSGVSAWVDLSAASPGCPLVQQVAAALGVRERRDQPPLDALSAHLGDTPFLLVLDNCEHRVDECAELVDGLLRTCRALRALTTSREALGVEGEVPWLVPPLSLPPIGRPGQRPETEEIARAEAVQLFLTRAQAALPSFRLTDANARSVAKICRRLDGIPLAIELAAARVRVLGPEQIADRLDDAFQLLVTAGRSVLPRHRTLRETIEWSYRLLDEPEQVLFRRLAVFAGGFSLEAVEAICPGEPIPPAAILDLLSALVDRSLVVMEPDGAEARYRQLETIRQYAARGLSESGETEDLRARHAGWMTALAEEAAPRIFGGASDSTWIARLVAEEGNLRAALEWSVECPDCRERAEVALRLTVALHWLWFARGLYGEGASWLTRALEVGVCASARLRARARTALGTTQVWLGELEAAHGELASAASLLDTELAAEAGDPYDAHDRAYALSGLGGVAALLGDLAAAMRPLDAAVAIVAARPPEVLTSFVHYWHGIAAQTRGEIAVARASLERAVEVGRLLGNCPGTAHPLAALGKMLAATGETAAARRCLRESLRLHVAAWDLWGCVQVAESVAALAAETEDPARKRRAVRLFAACHAFRARIGTPLFPADRSDFERRLGTLRRELGPAEFGRLWDEGRVIAPRQALALATEEAEETDGAAEDCPPELDCGADCCPPSTRPRLRVSALGPFDLAIEDPSSPEAGGGAGRCAGRARELLVLLLLHRGGLTKDQVALALWPDASPTQVRNLFHVTLHRLRRALGHRDWIVADGDRYRVSGEIDAEIDASRFEAEVSAALAAPAELARGDGAVDRLALGLALYRGELLQGTAAGEWCEPWRERYEDLYLRGLAALGEARLAGGRYAEAADTWRELLARDELDEESQRRLMVSLARGGDRAAALRSYRRLERLLSRELEADPEPETVALHERLRRGELDL